MPGAFQETVNTLDAEVVPLGIQLRRADKQLIHAERVAAEIADKIVRVHDVALRLRHLLRFPALADVGDHPLIEQAHEWLIEVDHTDVMKEHREEARIEEMQNR